MAKKAEREIVSCIQCRNAELHKFFDNPTIAYCVINKIPDVAISNRFCQKFDRTKIPNEVITHQSYNDKVPWKR